MPHYNLPHNHGQNIERVLDNMPSAEGLPVPDHSGSGTEVPALRSG